MHGEFIAVWSELPRDIWDVLIAEEGVPSDIFCELYRELVPALKLQPTVETVADIVDDPIQSRDTFLAVRKEDLTNERDLVTFLEKAHEVFEDFGDDPLSNKYFNLVDNFIDKFSLRYDLRRPCQLCPTLPGIFTSLVRELRMLTSSNGHLDTLMKDFESAIRDLRFDSSEGKIKTCIQKQMNLLEALGSSYPGVTDSTLGKISDKIGTWPHEKLKLAMKNLYAFSCDYPGIRHGGTPANALRAMDMRDMIAVSILLTGFTPYLGNNLNALDIFGIISGPIRGAPLITPASPIIASPQAPVRKGLLGWLQKILLERQK